MQLLRLPSALISTLVALLPPLAAAEGLVSNNASLLWGPYRPNLYLGLRPRVSDSLLLGMMWGKLDGPEKDLRHECDAADGMGSFGWTAYDSRYGGTQTIEDQGNNIDITTELVKVHDGPGMGNWAVRVRGTPRAYHPGSLKTKIVFYVAMEGKNKCSTCQLDALVVDAEKRDGEETPGNDTVSAETVNLHVKHPKLGTAEIRIPRPRDVGARGKHLGTVVKSIRPPAALKLWDAKTLFLRLLSENGDELPNGPGPGSMHFVQFTFQDEFEFDVLYSLQKAPIAMTSADLSAKVKENKKSFKSQFSYLFDPRAPFGVDDYSNFSQAAFSNLQGGLGFFSGKINVEQVDSKGNVKKVVEGPHQLLTHVPSRTSYPRGFLWDEGFHLLPILEWDADLAVEVVKSWFSLVNKDGWVAQEQVLGGEAESEVPEELKVQNALVANPPTLFWIVSKFVDMLEKKTRYYGHDSDYLDDKVKGKAFVQELYPRLKRHYEWFRKSQVGDVAAHHWPDTRPEEGYRWRGRRPGSAVASGLDDYPRVEPPDASELHIDALAWVGVMAEVLHKLALYVSNEPDVLTFQNHLYDIRHNIDALHWNEEEKMHCDTRLLNGKHTYHCPKGYVALFPFILGFVGPDSPHLSATLDLIADPSHLWSPAGIRSLSPQDISFGKGDNYWRGPIWININYLIIERLLYLGRHKGPLQARCRDLYNALRVNVVNTVFESYDNSGFIWEQYDELGNGKRAPGFTGWSALVVKIMAFPQLEGGVTGTVKDGFEWAVDRAAGNERWGGAAVLVAILGIVFVWVTRRRFLGTVRAWRVRRGARAGADV